jgi:hypothetical protein
METFLFGNKSEIFVYPEQEPLKNDAALLIFAFPYRSQL